MASGLVALLDDVAAIAKLAAASLDDVAAVTGRVGLKAAGVVVDDTAVTPRYVVGFTPARELPIILRIGLGSLRNKLVFLLPAALALSAFAPWAVTPLLMAGGAYLCFEAAEKIVEAVIGHGAPAETSAVAVPAKALEDQKVAGAIRTDLILSAEIMAIALADVAEKPILVQALVLALVGVVITVVVYGVVALIVKMDDVGLVLARSGVGPLRGLGRGLVRSMPRVMAVLSVVGTAAMAWVGGGIIVHGLEHYDWTAIPAAIHHLVGAAGDRLPALRSAVEWLAFAIGAGILGLMVGGLIVLVMAGWTRVRVGRRRRHEAPGPSATARDART